jgi:Xaa-Pro aminopeptidase
VRARLRDRAQQESVDGLLLLRPSNVRYGTGWHFSVNERPVGLWLPVDAAPVLFVPLLEQEAAEAVPGVEVLSYEEFPGPRPPALWMIEAAGARRIAVDALDASLLAGAEVLLDRLELRDLALPQRAIKEEDELALIREAASFADRVLERLMAVGGDLIGQGATEAELLADCTGLVRSELTAAHGDRFPAASMGITA